MAAPGWYPDPSGGGQRYFDGQQWTQHRATGLTEQQRKDALEQALVLITSRGGRVLATTSTTASVVVGQPVNHVVHLLATVFLCGLWLPAWAYIASTEGEKHMTVSVDEHGVAHWFDVRGRPLPMVATPAVK